MQGNLDVALKILTSHQPTVLMSNILGVLMQPRRHMPLSVSMALPADAAKQDFELRVASFSECGIFSPKRHTLHSDFRDDEPVTEVCLAGMQSEVDRQGILVLLCLTRNVCVPR